MVATLVIITAFIVILGSMLWVLPSPREKKQMQLRDAARRQGMSVQLAKIEDPQEPGEKMMCAVYRLHAPATAGKGLKAAAALAASWSLRRAGARDRHDMAVPGWVPLRTDTAPPAHLAPELVQCVARLPQDVVALEATPAYVAAYWLERGAIEEVMQLQHTLNRIQSLS